MPLTDEKLKEFDKPTLRPDQIDSYERDLENLEGAKHSKDIRHRGVLMQQLKKVQHDFVTQHPARHQLTGQEKDELNTYANELQRQFTENMPSQEQLRKNGVGAVDHLMRWEKANKEKVLRWKNIKRALEPDNDDTDYTNIEKFRPQGQMDRLRTDAQIQGHMAYTNVPPENWTAALGEGPQETPLKQAKRRQMSEEQRKAVGERLKQAREAKRHALAEGH